MILFVDAEFVQNHCIGRIEDMKISNIRNLFLISLALPLVMLLGCSSSEESSDGSSGGSSSCQSECAAVPDHKTDECMIACEA
jgi:hypothetical protein